MKIGVLIPDRNDRPEMLQNCLRMLKSQTVQPDVIEIVNDPPTSSTCDITKRYKSGYERFRNKGFDAILFIENDDWYHPTYIETMIKEWQNYGRPDMLGTCYTIYYHIKLFQHFTMHHMDRSSAMNTLIKPDLDINWCPDHEPYTDIHLWLAVKGLTRNVFKPEKHISIGIKHGHGLCGGLCHVSKLHQFVNHDHDKSFLKSILDPESFDFYSNFLNK